MLNGSCSCSSSSSHLTFWLFTSFLNYFSQCRPIFSRSIRPTISHLVRLIRTHSYRQMARFVFTAAQLQLRRLYAIGTHQDTFLSLSIHYTLCKQSFLPISISYRIQFYCSEHCQIPFIASIIFETSSSITSIVKQSFGFFCLVLNAIAWLP